MHLYYSRGGREVKEFIESLSLNYFATLVQVRNRGKSYECWTCFVVNLYFLLSQKK